MRVDFDLIIKVTNPHPGTGPVQTEELIKATLAGPRIAVEKVIEAIKQVAELV
jgi:hypothetical protein